MDISDFQSAIHTGFYGLIAVLGSLAISSLRSLNESVSILNVKIAVIISKIEGHDTRISALEKTKGENNAPDKTG